MFTKNVIQNGPQLSIQHPAPLTNSAK